MDEKGEPVDGLLRAASQRIDQGDLSGALGCYRQALTHDPVHPQANFHLAKLLLAAVFDPAVAKAAGITGNDDPLAEAVALLQGLTARHPRHPAFANLYGKALERAGQGAAACGAYLTAVNLVPSALSLTLDLLHCLEGQRAWDDLQRIAAAQAKRVDSPERLWACVGDIWRKQSQWQTAMASYRAALEIAPDLFEALYGMARAALGLRDLSQADQVSLQLCQIHGQNPRTWTVRAAVCRALEDFSGAVAACEQAIGLNPRDGDARALLATMLDQQKRYARSEPLFREVLEEYPQRQDIRYNFAGSLMAQDRPEEALGQYQQVVADDPTWGDAWTNLGTTHLALAQYQDAEQACQRALECTGSRSQSAEARYNLAWAQLAQGKTREGWRNFEARWELAGFSSPQRPFPIPRWTGEHAPRATLYLHGEQGLGDSLQMMQLISVARQRVGRVCLEIQPPLVRLAETVDGVDQVVAADYTAPGDLPVRADFHLPLMSLPHVLALELADLPGRAPYIAVPEAAQVPPAAMQWAKAHENDRKIGLVWAGAPSNKIDRFRSIPWDLLQPLMACSGIAWASLQLGPRADDAKAGLGPGALYPLLDGVTDMADTAARMGVLDMVIGVDTSVIHLAGALGKDVWMMVPFAPDYRWMDRGEGSPWYPSLRIFRQDRRGDWADVVQNIALALS